MLIERKFSARGNELREALDDDFKAFFEARLTRLPNLPEAAALAEKARASEEEYRKRFAREGLAILARLGDARDVDRVRKLLQGGFVDHSFDDIIFLGKYGSWSDIDLIVALLDKPGGGSSWLLRPNLSDEEMSIVANAVFNLGQNKPSELLARSLPDWLLARVIILIGDRTFKSLARNFDNDTARIGIT